MAPRPTQPLLDRMARLALGRGLPEPDAEDVVVAAWHRAVAAHDPTRGPFEALLIRTVQNACTDWWRQARTAPTEADVESLATPRPADLEQVAANQRRLIEALTDEERRLFATWALQKHLPQGTLDAAGAAARLGMDVRTYNNGKRRLKARIQALAAQWGLPPRAFFSLADDEGPRRLGVRHVG